MSTPVPPVNYSFSADGVRYSSDRLGNGAYFLPDSDGPGEDLIVKGNLSVAGTSDLAGALTVGTTSFVAPTTLNGSLAVLGATNLNGPAQCGAGFTVGGNLSVVSGNLSVAVGGTTTLQAVTCTTLSASSDVSVGGNESVIGSILIGAPPVAPVVQSQIRLIAGPPPAWAPINPYLQIGDNVAGNAAVRCQNIRTNELSCFSTQVVVAGGTTTASLGTAMVGAGSYVVTIVETNNTPVSSGVGYYNMALEGILRSTTGTLIRVGTGTSIGGGINGVTYTLTYDPSTFGMEIAIANTSTGTPPATFLVSVSCLSLVSYPE